MKPKPIFLFIFILLLTRCQPAPRQVQAAFYHWQTHLDLTLDERNYLDALNVKQLYAKFFDVDWDANQQQAIPLALINIEAKHLEQIQIIPTIFITNRTMLNIAEKDIPILAQKMMDKIKELYQAFATQPLTEIQLDCDWTMKSKDKYFALLQHLNQIIQPEQLQLSATIRLHQVKFFEKTGVPPVHKGMLMFYNMGNLNDITTKNSILDMAIAKDYFVNFDRYPLALDVALPIFAWGVLIRDEKMIKLINNLRPEQLSDSERFIKINSPSNSQNLFQIIKNTYLDGYYLYEGDRIRLEQVSLEDLEEATEQLDDLILNSNLTISFYHLDTSVIKHYPYENLEKIYQRFIH